ncbi:MAG TPA: UDP-3-O-(3-hydroxymyristoyl)glucosamine N-acyltransferase [Stellaceae bacterium]|jgi:UDP-3-O-[3-hydroxymyristoyl] glucosamine N-acyltransferase|nr:UDP-3-O-(3-hydroxymyristoyl)glucosamine N-acyltransferase [Stellaceae bacterium]
MADPRFFEVAGPFTVAEIAKRVDAKIGGAAEEGRVLRDVAPLETATETDLSFFDNRRYLDQFRATKAGAVIVEAKFASQAPAGATVLITPQPYRAYALAAQAFYPEPPPPPGIAPSAVIDPSATLGAGCAVEHNAIIGPGVVIGKRCAIGPNVVIGRSVVLGDDVRVAANATLSHCVIGSRVRVYTGVRIGQDGFGFAPDPTAPVKVPQLGRVIIGDDVEVGANTTIDRGAGPDTIIGSGTMIDNLVQIGHNVQVGRCCVIVALAGISGSTRLGDYVMVGGQVGMAGHLTIGDGAKIGAQAGVIRDIEKGEVMLGSPAMPIREFHYVTAYVRRLAAKHRGE